EAEEAKRSAVRAARPKARILQFFEGNPGRSITAGEVSQALGIRPGTVQLTMRRMSQRHELDRIAHGHYCLSSATDEILEKVTETREELLDRQAKLLDSLADIRAHNQAVAAEREIDENCVWNEQTHCMFARLSGHWIPKFPARPRFRSTSNLLDELC